MVDWAAHFHSKLVSNSLTGLPLSSSKEAQNIGLLGHSVGAGLATYVAYRAAAQQPFKAVMYMAPQTQASITTSHYRATWYSMALLRLAEQMCAAQLLPADTSHPRTQSSILFAKAPPLLWQKHSLSVLLVVPLCLYCCVGCEAVRPKSSHRQLATAGQGLSRVWAAVRPQR
jgi:acetyl esterase/lipase